MKKLIAAVVVAVVFMTQVGCFGSFPLTRQVWEFNRDVGGKIVQEAVFLAFIIIPVYGVTTTIDAIILNTVEFWSGETPMSMKEGDMEKKLVSNGDETWEVSVMKHQYLMKQIEGPQEGFEARLVFNPENAIWTYHEAGQEIDLVQIIDNDHLKVLNGSAEGMVYNINETDAEAIKADLLNETLAKK